MAEIKIILSNISNYSIVINIAVCVGWVPVGIAQAWEG